MWVIIALIIERFGEEVVGTVQFIVQGLFSVSWSKKYWVLIYFQKKFGPNTVWKQYSAS